MAARRLLPTLYGVGIGAAAIILGPVILERGHLLYRDAVSTPRTFLTDTTLGIDGLPPRAVPQDWVVGVLSSVLDGGFVVIAILFAALVLAGVGYGRLAARLVPASGRSGAAVAAVVSVWNPFVAERLLQGHWGLLVGYASLGWIIVALLDLHGRPYLHDRTGRSNWAQLAACVAVAGLTPSGSLLAGAVLIAVGLPLLLRRGSVRRPLRPRGIALDALAGVTIWIIGALPWLVATAITGSGVSASGSAGAEAFGLRAEPWLGGLGTAVGLGGIWNVDAVPASRTVWWAAVATMCLLVVVAVGSVYLWHRRVALDPTVGRLAWLAVIVVGAVVLAATPPGTAALGWLIDTVPGAGLLRDTQKFLALTMPFGALSAAAACAALRRWVPAGFAIAASVLLIVAPLPDLAWGVGGRLTPVHYPADWARVTQIVTADDGAVLLWPPGTVRRYGFTDGPSLDPAPRMLRAPVRQSGELVVDGITIDAADPTVVAAEQILSDGGSAADLARLGVGWVLIEGSSTPAPPAGAQVAFVGDDLRLYRIPDAQTSAVTASTAAPVAAWTANTLWALTIIVGLFAALRSSLRRSR